MEPKPRKAGTCSVESKKAQWSRATPKADPKQVEPKSDAINKFEPEAVEEKAVRPTRTRAEETEAKGIQATGVVLQRSEPKEREPSVAAPKPVGPIGVTASEVDTTKPVSEVAGPKGFRARVTKLLSGRKD